jgi:alpha-D-xyloside xylohydrolase
MLERKIFGALIIFFFISCFYNLAGAQVSANFTKNSTGVIVYPDTRLSGNTQAVRLQVISDKIIRVTASPQRVIPDRKSLITVNTASYKNFTVTNSTDKVSVKTPAVTASVLLSTGALSFADAKGSPIVMERQHNGRNLTPAVFEGEPTYGLTQIFETSSDDAYYGLGQHQDDQYNYKGGQVYMFQNNTEVAVPFLISKKNYGILWDNYSLSKVGDAREYMPLSSLKLYSKQGDEGWLTASYSNDRKKPQEVAFTKAESEINYRYVDATKTFLPKEFNIQNGVVNWEGSIASGFDGVHKFNFFYAGYTKMYIDGKLMLDRWRQAWNPGSGVVTLNMQKGKKYTIRIEWTPDGGESYLAVRWLNPIAEKDVNSYTFASESGKQVDYYFVSGKNMDEVISGYRTITGKATIVPKWAMGFWQSRERYKTQEEILNTASEFRKRKIPLDNIVLDWSYWKENQWGSQEFDTSRFPNPDQMISDLHTKYKTQIMISVWPKFYEGVPSYDEFNKKGWLYKRNIADRQRDWIAQGYTSTFYDAFNVQARHGFWNLINTKLYSKGIDAWWMDASEPDILSNVSPERRKAQMSPTALGTAAEYLNAYPLENAKGIYNGQRSVDPNKRVFLLTRSGFAGSQHYAASIWSGDIASRWTDMKAQISAGLNFSMSGLPFWTMDAGGFSVERRYENAKGEDLDEWRELNARWYQFSSFVPLFRVHGQFPFREIYNIAPEDHPAYQSMLYYNKLRYRLMPYIYSLAGMTYHKDYTIMRGLVMDFAKDTTVTNIGDQYMFGPSLLINPVYNYKERNKKLYLPAGQGWYNLYNGKYESGGKYLTEDAPYERMPVYVKEGSIIPFGPELQYTAEKPADTITLYVYTGKDAAFTLYEDENTNYNYEKGRFSNIPFVYNEANKTLTIDKREGSFNGMLAKRTFKIIWITKTKSKNLDFVQKEDAIVQYEGAKIAVAMK